MKPKLYLSYISFCILLISFLVLVFIYDHKVIKNKTISCNELNFELSKNLLPKNFGFINLSLDFVDNRKWHKIVYNNHQSFFKNGYFSNNQSAKAIITISLKKNLKCILQAKVKPHGDLEDHHLPITELPSMQIYLENGHFFGIVKFLLLKPKTRTSVDDEIVAATINKKMGFLSPRTSKAVLIYNNNKIDFIFQEKIVKEFIEYNRYRESLLFSNDDRLHYNKNYDPIDVNFYKINNSKIIVKNKQYLEAFERLDNLNKKRKNLERFINKGHIVTPDVINLNEKYNGFFNKKFLVFDVLQLALNAEHSVFNDNRRIYYDFMNKEFLPIYYDGMARLFPFIETQIKKNKNINKGGLINLEKFKKIEKNSLIKELENLGVSKNKSEILTLLKKIEKRLTYLSSDTNNEVSTGLDYKNINKVEYKNDKYFKAILITLNKLLICNESELKCFNVEIKNEDLKKLISQNYKYKEFPVILVNKFYNEYIGIFNDKPSKKENIINTTIEKFNLTLYGDISYKFNAQLRKLTLIKNSVQARALINNNSILKNIKIEFVDNSIISNSDDPKKYLIDKHGLTGCLTIYDSVLRNVEIDASDSNCEDAINIVKSEGDISSIKITNSLSDAFDADFSYINVNNFNIKNAKNDCIDFSGGVYYLNYLTLDSCSDKGLSAENSTIKVNDISISNSLYGIASKDFSDVYVEKIFLDKVDICWHAYNKKQEFGGGKILLNSIQSKALCQSDENIKERSKIEFGNVF